MKKTAKRLFQATLAMLVLAACTEGPPPTLAYKDREVVDSLFRHRTDSLRPIFDSICTARFDSAVKFKTDSMLKVRTAEIQRALERLHQETNQ